MAMTEQRRKAVVGVAEFKANLSKYLRSVQQGDEVTVHDRQTPIARIVPVASMTGSLPVRSARGSLRSLRILAPPVGWEKTDSRSALDAERQER
jgi:prevent-host-death family protein